MCNRGRVTLLIGATGVLRPAAAALVADGRNVVGVARHVGELDRLAGELGDRFRGVAVDATGPALVQRLTETTRLGDVAATVAYAPATSRAHVRRLAEITNGPVVEILTSSAAVPAGDGARTLGDLPTRDDGVRRLVLGWHSDPVRWHYPLEISEAALAMLAGTVDDVLGVVRPWSERPL